MSGMILIAVAILNIVFQLLYHVIGITTVLVVSVPIFLGGICAIAQKNDGIVLIGAGAGLIPLGWPVLSLLSFISFFMLAPGLALKMKVSHGGSTHAI